MKRFLVHILCCACLFSFSQSPKKLFRQAQKDFEAKNYSQSETSLTEALKLKPNYFRYHLLRAEAREKQLKLPEALEDYMICAALKKHDKKLLMKTADLDIALKRYDDAILQLSALLEFDEKNNDAVSKKVLCLIITKKFRDAVSTCDASFLKNYYNHLTHFYKAVALDSLGDQEGAHKDYTTAITLMKNEGDNAKSPLPKFKPYFANIALVEHRLNKYDEALKNFAMAVKIDPADTVEPKNYVVFYNQANTYLAKSDFTNAHEYLTKAIVKNETDKEIIFRRGYVNQLTKQFQNAISDYTKTLNLDGNHYPAIRGRAQCYLELGLLQDAIADFSKARAINPNDQQVSEVLASTKKKLFEANRENEDPEITINYPVAEQGTGFINIFASQADVIVEGAVRDKSLIEKITVNNISASYANEKNPSFICSVPVENAGALEIVVTDVYGNFTTKKFKIGRVVDDSKVKVHFSGRLLTDDGTNRPFINSYVYLTNEKGEILYSAKTDDKGKFIFRNLGYDKNYLLSMDAEDSQFSDVQSFRMVDENGKTIMKSVAEGKKKFRFSILPSDYNVMSMMTIDDAPIMLDLSGKLLAGNEDKTPIGNIKFLLLNERREAMAFTSTTPEGKFIFANVMPYDYEFAVDDIDAKKIPYETIIVTDEKGRIIRQIKKDGEGKFRFRLLEQERNFITSIALSESDPWLSLDNLSKEKNEKIIIENIYYESGSFKLLPEAEAILQKTIEAMKKNPKLTLEVQSHTDAVAGDEYNMELSIRRANAVVEFLVSKGLIDKKRLSAKGFGELQLTNRCLNGVECSDAEHRQNRRTVFVLNYSEKLK